MMVVKALLFMNGFALLIGVLIIFLDKVISNYGDCRITINGDKEFMAPGGKSLLRVLFENKYFIPSACGGKGTCGYCKLKLIDSTDKALPTEALVLTSKEMYEGYRLACQVKVRSDMNIEIPPEYLEIQEYACKILSTELVTSDIKKVRIGLSEEDSITFKPGQYVQVKFESPTGIDYRAYSIASHPDNHDMIELNVKKIPEGLGSGYIHSLNEGDPIEISGPYGDFYLQTDSHHKIICVAGGVGLAPLKSIVEYWKDHATNRVIELYYGARNLKELYDHGEFVALNETYENFKYYPALSDDVPEWTGERGFIHMVLDKYLEDGHNCEGYLCGPQIMIDAVTDVLVKHKVLPERIWYDKF